MKVNFYVLFSTLLFFITASTFAQKNIEKEWKSKLKELSPLDYKALVEERDNLQKEYSDCSSSKAAMRAETEGSTTEIERLKSELDAAKKSLEVANASGGSGPAESSGAELTSTKSPAKGVQFKVQIGNFRNKDLSKYFENNKNFSGEIDEDGTKKYTLGLFSDYWEADKFKKYLRDMGVKDAWIVSYKDGKRVNIKDALEGTL